MADDEADPANPDDEGPGAADTDGDDRDRPDSADDVAGLGDDVGDAVPRGGHDIAGGGSGGDDQALDGPEADPFDDDVPPPPRGLGTFELVLIGGAVVAVVGLAVGVAVLVLGS